MYDAPKIITGLAVFIAIITTPLWYNQWTGKAQIVPKPKIVTDKKQCVRPVAYMREYHMTMLDEWRTNVIRNADRRPVTVANEQYQMSLSNTCITCHSNKSDFCDQCHNYLGVTPSCWDCHTFPKEKKDAIH